MISHRKLFLGYFILLLGIIIYSYSQIDLNLTLSTNKLYQFFQNQLIQLGYYQRPLSAVIFLSLIGLSFGVYFWILKQIKQKKLNFNIVRWMIIITTILILAYPAFSHDIFNYMFDARVVTKYGLDPAYFKALDFPADTWTRFMNWTHRYYPYGPGWLVLTWLPSFLGIGKFVWTLLLFKTMFLGFHMANAFLIYKILKKISPNNAVFGMAFFALNPLVLIESLVSPHNEVMMFTFALYAIYLMLKNRVMAAVIALTVSVSIKFISAVLLLLFRFRQVSDKLFFRLAYFFWLAALVPLVINREPYAWYFVPLVGLGALNADSGKILTLTAAVSAGLILRYTPYLYLGEYTLTTTELQDWGMVVGIIVVGVLSYRIFSKTSANSR